MLAIATGAVAPRDTIVAVNPALGSAGSVVLKWSEVENVPIPILRTAESKMLMLMVRSTCDSDGDSAPFTPTVTVDNAKDVIPRWVNGDRDRARTTLLAIVSTAQSASYVHSMLAGIALALTSLKTHEDMHTVVEALPQMALADCIIYAE